MYLHTSLLNDNWFISCMGNGSAVAYDIQIYPIEFPGIDLPVVRICTWEEHVSWTCRGLSAACASERVNTGKEMEASLASLALSSEE